jgi:hypothetical protein
MCDVDVIDVVALTAIVPPTPGNPTFVLEDGRFDPFVPPNPKMVIFDEFNALPPFA